MLSISLGFLFAEHIFFNEKNKFFLKIFFLMLIILILYTYVYIFDSRNGIFFALFIIIFSLFKQALGIIKIEINPSTANLIIKKFILIGTCCFIGIWFAAQQNKLNSGWKTTIEDAQIAMQIEKYSNWQNPQELGYPNGPNGQWVKSNTYERISWMVAGIKIFSKENMLGIGVLNRPFGILLNQKFTGSGKYINSTHSAWVDMLLAFGVPSLALIFCTLASILYLAFRANQLLNSIGIYLSICIFLSYATGELSSQHAIEILFFMLSALSTMLIKKVT
jgi:hypothetical protein